MKNKLKKSFAVLLSILSVGFLNTVVFASNENNPETYEVTIEMNMDDVYTTIENIYSEIPDEYDEIIVNVIDPELSNPDINEFEDAPLESPSSRRIPLLVNRKKLVNIRSTGQTTGSTVLVQGTGQKGMTITINQTKGVSNTVSANVSIPTFIMTAQLGFTNTKQESISVSGSSVIPNTWTNGGTLKAYPIYNNYSFDVHLQKYDVSAFAYEGKGTAKRAVGASFKLTRN